MPQVAARMKGRVKLNIGGARFETSADTLRKSDWFAALLSGKFETQPDEDGYLFIDRDGAHFATILNYLRMGTRALRGLELTEGQRLQLLEETQYYQLNGLAGALVQPPIGSGVTIEVATVDLVEQRVSCELPHACGCTHPPGSAATSTAWWSRPASSRTTCTTPRIHAGRWTARATVSWSRAAG
mmetsp:Transcript_71187/g.222069  ORF Transcript_71187/g.222069 Transcript_71187/m.222069 type:complete len:185 (-) Transcript_71187:49-603(-)